MITKGMQTFTGEAKGLCPTLACTTLSWNISSTPESPDSLAHSTHEAVVVVVFYKLSEKEGHHELSRC
jgi:hypothetical protein